MLQVVSRHRAATQCRRAGAPALLLFLAWAQLAGCRSPQPPASDSPRDVVILSVDTLRADRLGVGGRTPSPTPRLDALARAGTYFRQATTPMPRTTPGLASLHTGLWPHHHGSREVGEPIVAGVTLATLLRDAGYATLAVSANSTAGPDQGLGAGFDRFVTYEEIVERYGDRLYRDFTPAPPDGVGWAEAVTDQALELLSTAEPGRPLYLWVFYFDPHFLYRPPSPWQDGVAADRCWELYAWGDSHRAEAGAVFSDRNGRASRSLADCAALYDAEVAYVDHEIGRLVDGLRRRRSFENSLLVFTSDHGENLGEGGLFYEHGPNVHDAALRVPLLFRGPSIEPREDADSASLVDVVPTLLSLLGRPAAELPVMDGEDLSPRLTGGGASPEGSPRIAFAESATSMWNDAFEHLTTGRPTERPCLNDARLTLCLERGAGGNRFRLYDHSEDPELRHDLSSARPDETRRLREAFERWPPASARYRAARTPFFKLVERPRLAGGYSEALYDLLLDPAEREDVRDLHPLEAARLRRALAAWTAGMPLPGSASSDPQLTERLRALGYVQ